MNDRAKERASARIHEYWLEFEYVPRDFVPGMWNPRSFSSLVHDNGPSFQARVVGEGNFTASHAAADGFGFGV